MKSPAVFRAFWIAGGLALLLGALRDPTFNLFPPPRELPRADGATGRPWITGDYAPVRGQQAIADGPLAHSLPQATTWRGGDAARGRAETAWFRLSRATFYVDVAGYPQRPGLRVHAEFRQANGEALASIDCPLPDPREEWSTWTISRPAGAAAVRLVVEDRSAATFGWVAISHPYRSWPRWLPALFLQVQAYATAALALTLLLGPGLLFLRRGGPAELHALLLLTPGPLLLAALGLVLWGAGGGIAVGLLGRLLVISFWLVLGVLAARHRFDFPLSTAGRRALALTALLVIAVVAKSSHSIGPEGETFGGSISRNLAAGDRLDSRFSFYVVQAVAHHWGPSEPAVEKLFYPWTFFSRGPLAGLIAAPVVFATGGLPPAGFPEQRWSPFDREGFAAYRITLIALASGIVLACFLVLSPLLGEGWALIAAGLVALSPFGVHEVMFTWPKWAATACLVTAFGLAHARRTKLAGLTLGLGFLYHPLVLLWTPWLALWVAGRAERRTAPVVAALLRLGVGAALLVLPWMVLGRFMPHPPDTPFAGQAGFFRYLVLADSNLCTWSQWWHSRWLNFANTFLPLHLIASDASFHHFRLNSTYEVSGPLVKFAFVWWNTLPFALGLGLWILSLVGLIRGWRKFRAAILVLVAGPAVLAVIYWGMDPLGLMRECGHPLFIAIVALGCAFAAHSGGWLARLLSHPAFPWLQLPETLAMLWLTTLLNPRPSAVQLSHLDPAALVTNLLALTAAAWLLAHTRRDLPAAPAHSADSPPLSQGSEIRASPPAAHVG